MICVSLISATQMDAGDACEGPGYWSGTQNVTISVKGHERLFELYSPWESRGQCGANKWCTGPPTSRYSGVVLNWHGCNTHLPLIDYHTEISRVNDVAADRGNYFTITPLGTESPEGWGWNADGIPCGTVGVDDWAFFEAIMSWIDKNLCADMKKIYTVGFSTGAFLSYGIACRYPHLIAAAGADAGGLSKTEYVTCRAGSGAVPIQAFHSLADPTVPYNGTSLWASQADMDALWRERNGCSSSTEGYVTFKSETTTCVRWDCALAPVESCALQNIDHCWYGGRSGGFPSCARRAGDIDATTHMFDFWDSIAASAAVGGSE